MGMDGLSMANTGALKESTSADFSSRTEQVMQADKTNDAQQVQTMGTNPRIKEKEEEEQSKKQKKQEVRRLPDLLYLVSPIYGAGSTNIPFLITEKCK